MSTKTVKLAIFEDKTSKYRSQYTMEANEYVMAEDSDYILLSNVVEVEFDLRPEPEVIFEKVEALREKRARLNYELDEQIAKLLALPNPEDFGVAEEDMGGAR